MAENIQGKTDMHLHLDKGALHRKMGYKDGEKIPVEALHKELAAAKKRGDTETAKQVNFALTARNWSH